MSLSNKALQLDDEQRLLHFLTIDGLDRSILTEILDTAEGFTGVSERTIK
ncbi:MAG: aspartate carbamoyltransferase catalytic subunit, partial [Candidatus Thiodiazotropha lotti]